MRVLRACPFGSGYPLQVLIAFRAFHFYPSRKGFYEVLGN